MRKYGIIFFTATILLGLPATLLAHQDAISADAFGMNIHLRQRVSQSEWTTALDLADEAGVHWAREQFNWDVLESIDGQFDFDSYDAVLDAYAAHDIKVVGLLTYSSSWASSNSGATDYEFYPPDMTAWEDYVTTVTAHYAGRIDHWEIWNEPNYEGFWKGSTDDYVELLDTAATAIKTANPNAVIILGGLSGADANYLDTIYDKISDPALIDVVAIHPYRTVGDSFNYAPETVTDGLNSLTTDIYNIKAVMNAYDQSTTPIWLTEVGWTTGADGISQRRQADYLTRLYTEALAIPDVKKIFWYSLNDTSTDESYNDAQFGLSEDDYSPKAALTAYQYVQQHLVGRFFKDQTLPGARVVDDFSTSRGWEFAGTLCTEGNLDDHSNGVLDVSYHFTGPDNCYAPITLNQRLSGSTRALQFKAKGSNDNTLLRVRLIDAKGETFQYNLGYLPNEWLYYTIQLNQPVSFWGGDKDGQADQPVTLNALVLDDTDGSLAQGEVMFDDLLASGHGQTYLYRFHQDNKDLYAYWTSAASRALKLHLAGAGKIRQYRFQKDSQLYESGNADYLLRSNRTLTFLQTL